MNDTARPRVAMIGVDAAELERVRAWAPVLPNLRRALETGVVRTLRSTADTLAGSVWPTFYTGTPPARHGIYHHLQWDPAAMRLRRVGPDWLDCEPFWYELAERGVRVTAIDVPMTFAPRLLTGVEVTCWGSHDTLVPFATRPPGLAREIRRTAGRHPMGVEIPVRRTMRGRARARAALIDGARRKGRLSRRLLETTAWDFFITVFGECHRGGHLLWPEGDETGDGPIDYGLRDVYAAVDAAVGEILASPALDGATVILFALHGMGPNTSQSHLLPRIMDRINRGFAGTAAPADRPQQRSRRLLRERLPARVQDAVARAVPTAFRARVVDRAVTGGHDWARTPGLALLSDLGGYIRFNVRGREREGVLEPGAAALDPYAGWVRSCLLELRSEVTREPIVRAVRAPADGTGGGRAGLLPDLVVDWSGAPPAAGVRSERLGAIAADGATGPTGNHRPDGFFVMLRPPPDASGPLPDHIAELAGLVSRLLRHPTDQGAIAR